MSTNKFQYWPSDGQLGSTKFTMPTNAEDWPSGDTLVGNFVYKEGKLVDFVDTKALIVNDSKTTTINYDYVNIELPFAEDAMTINRGPRNKYLIIKFNNEEVEEGGSVIVTLKYKGCETVDDVKAVDPDYLTNDIIDGVWSEGLGDLEQGGNGKYNGGMFYGTNLTTFSSDLPNLTDGGSMFNNCSNLTSFNSDLSSLTNGAQMFKYCSNLTSFSSDLSSLTDGGSMFYKCSKLTSFSSDLSSLINGMNMFNGCKIDAESVMYIADTIKDITAEKQLYIDGTIPYVTLSNDVYSAPKGFMSDGKYVYTYNNPEPYTTTISASNVGKLTLGINVTNNSSTIQQQLEDFAQEANFETWADLKKHFTDKGWTVTFQYGGTTTNITYDMRGERAIPCPIYTQLVEEEDKDRAEYCNEEGTKFYNIDWGHDVTNTDDYSQFDSIEDAMRAFNVFPKENIIVTEE